MTEGEMVGTAVRHPAIDDPWENMVYRAHVRAAGQGAPALSHFELSELIGASSVSTVPDVEHRLAARGVIEVQRFQRGRRIKIVATGETTAQPCRPVPHWRDRPEHQAKIDPVALLKARHPELFKVALQAARRAHRSPAAYLADLLAAKLSAIQAEREGK